MIITQLIYVHPGQEVKFEEFESLAIPLIQRYNGELLLRIRPADDCWVQAAIEKPYEIHLIRFDSETDYESFIADDERKHWLYLKEQAIRGSVLVKGEIL